MNISESKKSVFSSPHGEDGIIEYIFNIIYPKGSYEDEDPHRCIDVGAHNGVFGSNTRNLIISHNWSSLQIEGDPARAAECKESFNKYNVVTDCCFVDYNFSGKNTLDKIIARNNFSRIIDFISIDVDGLDFYIFENMQISPILVCIEVQSIVDQLTHTPYHIDKASLNIGQGLTVMTDMANKKGYELIFYTGNAFYIRKEFISKLKITNNSPRELFNNFWKTLSDGEKTWLRDTAIQQKVINELMV